MNAIKRKVLALVSGVTSSLGRSAPAKPTSASRRADRLEAAEAPASPIHNAPAPPRLEAPQAFADWYYAQLQSLAEDPLAEKLNALRCLRRHRSVDQLQGLKEIAKWSTSSADGMPEAAEHLKRMVSDLNTLTSKAKRFLAAWEEPDEPGKWPAAEKADAVLRDMAFFVGVKEPSWLPPAARCTCLLSLLEKARSDISHTRVVMMQLSHAGTIFKMCVDHPNGEMLADEFFQLASDDGGLDADKKAQMYSLIEIWAGQPCRNGPASIEQLVADLINSDDVWQTDLSVLDHPSDYHFSNEYDPIRFGSHMARLAQLLTRHWPNGIDLTLDILDRIITHARYLPISLDQACRALSYSYNASAQDANRIAERLLRRLDDPCASELTRLRITQFLKHRTGRGLLTPANRQKLLNQA